MSKEFKIYCYTNRYTGEKYIGSTCKTLKSRAGKNGRGYCRTNTRFKDAIDKYGWESFDVEVLDITDDDREASRLERHYINRFNTDVIGIGYNGNKGGGVPTHKGVTQLSLGGAVIAHYSASSEASSATGIDVTSIIDCCGGRIKTSGGFVWRYDAEKNERLDEKDITPFSGERRVDQLSMNGEFIQTFNSAKEAEFVTGALRSKICMCCKGQRKTAGGYKWRYTDGFSLKDIYNPRPSKVRRVEQYSVNGDLIEVYESLSDAHRVTGWAASSIANVCKGKRQEFAGFVWKYAS